jgi:hypothetical protein
MVEPIITNNDVVGVVIRDALFDDETLTAAAAETWPAGTLLGRITASGKLTKYASAAVDGSQVPVCVLTEEAVFAAAGDLPCRVLVSGEVRNRKVGVWTAGSPPTLTAANTVEREHLRDYGINVVTTRQLAELDNQ